MKQKLRKKLQTCMLNVNSLNNILIANNSCTGCTECTFLY